MQHINTREQWVRTMPEHWVRTMPELCIISAAAAKSLQSCRTLCDRIDGSPPGSPVPGILQARPLEWVAISFSNASKWKVNVKALIRVRLFTAPWTAAYQAPLSTGFSRQEEWSGLPLSSLQLSVNQKRFEKKKKNINYFLILTKVLLWNSYDHEKTS